jgi:hypothetical protein
MARRTQSLQDFTEALEPLRARARELQLQSIKEQDSALQRWIASEKPVLREHAHGLKESMTVLTKEEALLKDRVSNLSTNAVPNQPGITTGFNVIRSRTDAAGQPLSIDALKTERTRLSAAVEKLNIDLAAARAEITDQTRRCEEQEIWETKLVALQDTIRVYRDEINLIEVELLGREHYAKVAEERARAEESGTAQLRRVQEQLLQTRVKLNRAKQQYYFPKEKGYNITFGGGGVYGACKDIVICEINGGVHIKAEVGERRGEPVASLIFTFQAAGNGSKPPASSSSALNDSNNMNRNASMRRTTSTQSEPASPSKAAAARMNGFSSNNNISTGMMDSMSLNKQQSAVQQQGKVRKSLTFPNTRNTTGSGGEWNKQQQQTDGSLGHNTIGIQQSKPSSSAVPPPSPYQTETAAGTTRTETSPPRPAVQPSPLTATTPSSTSKQTKQGNAAVRFLKRIGKKKDKYQGKQQHELEPARELDEMMDDDHEDGGGGPGGKRRTLAGKLLSRTSKSSKQLGGNNANNNSGTGHGLGTNGSRLDSLAFGGNRLGGGERSQSTLFGDEDESQSMFVDNDASVLEEEEGEEEEVGYNSARGGRGLVNVEEHDEGDGSLASEDDFDDEDDGGGGSGNEESQMWVGGQGTAVARGGGQGTARGGASTIGGSSGGGRGSWLRGAAATLDTMSSALDDGGESSTDSFNANDTASAAGQSFGITTTTGETGEAESNGAGCYVMGRLLGFDLVGERGSKCPNLTIGAADVKATVFVKMTFEYTKSGGWKPHSEQKPLFDVQKLAYKIRGNNVPMPQSLIRQILKVAIPGLIQRRLLADVMVKEFGDYLLHAEQGVDIKADVALVGPSLGVLDADLAFEVRGPATSAKEAKRQQAKYAAAKQARGLLGLSLPQAQALSMLFNGKNPLIDPQSASAGPVSIRSLISFQALHEKVPKVYRQLCQVLNTGYQVVTEGRRDPQEDSFDFLAFMEGQLWKVRQKPARARVIVRSLDVPLSVDSIVTAIHDWTERTLEEVFIKGPQSHPDETVEEARANVEGEFELLRAWHAFALRELSHFKSKFRGAGGTVLAAADAHGFSAGMEHCHYEGPLKIRLPVSMQVDADGAFSFILPLPSPEGGLGVFVDQFKALTVPAHTRPPAAAVNWVELSGDSELDGRMKRQLQHAVALITEVLQELKTKIVRDGLDADDADPVKVLTQPRTKVGDKLGRLIVSRLQVKVRLDERRIGEILGGLDATTMGGNGAFIATAGRILGHLGDVMTLGFTPTATGSNNNGDGDNNGQYLFQFESSDISRLRADIASLGFQSLVTPGGAVRLVHSALRAFLIAFQKDAPDAAERMEALQISMQQWYQLMTRDALDISVCLDAKGEVVAEKRGDFIVTLSGQADEAALRATSPLVLTNELELVRLGRAMRGDPPQPQSRNFL